LCFVTVLNSISRASPVYVCVAQKDECHHIFLSNSFLFLGSLYIPEVQEMHNTKFTTIPPFCGVVFNVLLVTNKSGLSRRMNTDLAFLASISSLGAKNVVTVKMTAVYARHISPVFLTMVTILFGVT
jgi:hypothetical protein